MSFKVDFDPGQSLVVLGSIETKLENITKKANTAASEMGKIGTSASQSGRPVNQLKKEVDALAKTSEKSAKGLKDSADGASKVGRSSKYAAQEAAAFRAGMNALGTHMGIFTGQTIATAAAVYAVVSAFKTVITTGTEFTGSMVRANAIMSATVGEAKLLEQEVRHLGETTVFTATEAAGGLTALAMAGLSAGQALEALDPALSLAVIGQIDMYKSADILTNVMNGFRLEASDIPRIVDDLATAITSSNSTIEQMGTALSYVAPVASATGAEIEEVVAILEVFHNTGIKASRAGTSLRRAYVNLLKPSGDARDTLLKLNVATRDINGNMRDMSNIMRDLANAGATSADLIALFGVRAVPAMQALMDDMRSVNSEFEIFRANLMKNEGAAENLREAFEDYLGADARKLMSALEEKAIVMFGTLEDGLRQGIQNMTEFVQSFSSEEIEEFMDDVRELSSLLLTMGTFFADHTPAKLLFDALSEDADKATVSIEGLTEAQRKQAEQQALAQEQARKTADSLLAYVGETKGGQELDKEEKKFIKRIGELGKKRREYVDAMLQLQSDVAVAPQLDAEGSDHSKAIQEAAVKVEDYTGQIDKLREQLAEYRRTGLTEDTIKRNVEFAESLKEIKGQTFKQESADILRQMATSIKEISASGKGSVADTLLGSQDEIDARSAQITARYTELRQKLQADFDKYDPTQGGKMQDAEMALELAEDLSKLDAEYSAAMGRITEATLKAEGTFVSFTDKAGDMIVSGQQNVATLQSEIEVLTGVADVTKTVTELKREAKAIELEAAAERLASVQGRESEAAQLQVQATMLRNVNALLADQKKIKDDLKEDQQLEKDFESGKFLSDRMKAEQEYAEGMLQLRKYMNEGMFESDADYVEAQNALYDKMVESTNDKWFSMAESMSKTVGQNIAQAVTLQQTWEETTDNIKKAIIGGIVGSLIEEGTQMAANALLHKIFGEQRKASDASVTAEEVRNAAVRTAAKQTEATAASSAAIANQGGGDPYTAFLRMAAMTALVTAIPQVVSGLFGTREIGGPVMSNQSYLVGERGPEIFTPTVGGAITSNADIRRNFSGNNNASSSEPSQIIYEGDKYYIDAIDTKSFQDRLADNKQFIHSQNYKIDRRRGRV